MHLQISYQASNQGHIVISLRAASGVFFCGAETWDHPLPVPHAQAQTSMHSTKQHHHVELPCGFHAKGKEGTSDPGQPILVADDSPPYPAQPQCYEHHKATVWQLLLHNSGGKMSNSRQLSSWIKSHLARHPWVSGPELCCCNPMLSAVPFVWPG